MDWLFASLYRPYWGYYLVHTSVFLVPLASVGFSRFIDELASESHALRSESKLFGFGFKPFECALILSLASICGFTLGRVVYDAKTVLASSRPDQDPLISEIIRGKGPKSMLYTSNPHYGYYCDVPLIPEYVVPSLKNVAQNQLTTSNLLVLTKSHPVDMLHVLRDVELTNVAWIQYLNEYCRLIYSGTDEELWVTDRRKISVKMTTPTDFTDSRLKPIVW